MKAMFAGAVLAIVLAATPAATQAPDTLRTGRWEEHLYPGEYRADEKLDPAKTPIPAKYYCLRPADTDPRAFLAKSFKAAACRKQIASVPAGTIDMTTECARKGAVTTTRFKGATSADAYRVNVEIVDRDSGGGKATITVTASGRWMAECRGDETPIGER